MKREGLRGFTVSHSNFHGGSSTTGYDWKYNNGNEKSSSEVRQVHIDRLLYEPAGPHVEYYCPNCVSHLTKIMVRDTQHTSNYDTLPHSHDPDDDLTHRSFLGMIYSNHGEEVEQYAYPEEFRCTSCFSFLIRFGNWFNNPFKRKKQGTDITETPDVSITINSEPAVPLVGSTVQSGNKMAEILKSIVYGGLTESVTSLGIVTSAATAHAATLSIVVLALANLIGGLFTIGLNLWELKNDHSNVPSEETGEQVYQYEEKLGKRQNFILHATFAILSFLVFGLVPPIVYGFSFRQSDDRDLKIAAVGIASLACITLLAVAKASIQRPQKYIKTVAYYIALGFGVSVLSYAAGDLVNKLLEQLGWFHSAGASNTLLLSLHPAGMGTMKPSRQSY